MLTRLGSPPMIVSLLESIRVKDVVETMSLAPSRYRTCWDGVAVSVTVAAWLARTAPVPNLSICPRFR